MADGQTGECSAEKIWLGSIQIIGVIICPVLENETIVELHTEIAYSGKPFSPMKEATSFLPSFVHPEVKF